MQIDIQITEKLNGACNAVNGTDIKVISIEFTDISTEREITRAIQVMKMVKEVIITPLYQNQVYQPVS